MFNQLPLPNLTSSAGQTVEMAKEEVKDGQLSDYNRVEEKEDTTTIKPPDVDTEASEDLENDGWSRQKKLRRHLNSSKPPPHRRHLLAGDGAENNGHGVGNGGNGGAGNGGGNGNGNDGSSSGATERDRNHERHVRALMDLLIASRSKLFLHMVSRL